MVASQEKARRAEACTAIAAVTGPDTAPTPPIRTRAARLHDLIAIEVVGDERPLLYRER
jgi:hypothetical protein